MNRPKNDPQSYTEMLTEAKAKKTTVTYRAESGQYVDGEISKLVTMSTEELARIVDGIGVVRLDDTEAVKRKAVEYLRVCSETSTLPGIGGLCRALGYSLEGVRRFRKLKPNHPTTEFLELFRDLCSDVLSDAALRGYTNNVYSIFYQKAMNNLSDSIRIEAVPYQGKYYEEKTPDELESYLKVIGDDL